MYLAAKNGRLDCLEALINAKSDVHETNDEGFTPLLIAAQNGHLDCVRALARAKALINQPNHKGYTLLIMAAEKGAADCVNTLLELGASVNQAIEIKKSFFGKIMTLFSAEDQNNGATAIFMAAAGGHLPCLILLIKAGAKVNQPNAMGQSPLMIAILNNQQMCIESLLENGAEYDYRDPEGKNPLFLAAKHNNLAAITVLLKKGANVNQASHKGCTPLFMAVEKDFVDCAAALIAAQANPNQAMEGNYTPLHMVSQNGHKGSLEMLLKAGADCSQRDQAGNTPLAIATINGRHDCLVILLAAGANVQTPNKKGNAPLAIAAANGHNNCLAPLIGAGANIQACNQAGDTALALAAQYNHSDCLSTLIVAGGNINSTNQQGQTPLFIASAAGYQTCVSVLCRAGADPMMPAPVYTAIDIAREKGHQELIDFFTTSASPVTPLVRSAGNESAGTQLQFNLDIAYVDLKIDEKTTLGQGAFGVVYKAEWKNELVAVKQSVLRVLTPAIMDSLKKEALQIAQLQFGSDHLVRLKGLSVDNIPCIVMEYLPHTLSNVLASDDVLEWSVRYRIGVGISRGLAHLHRNGVIHRDIKSPNILLTDMFQAKIGDLGLAEVKQTTHTLNNGGAAGSIPWMAPEVLKGDNNTRASDIYAVGMVFWEMTARKFPYQGFQANQVMTHVLQGKRETLEADLGYDSRWSQALTDCWDQLAEKRPTADKLVETLTPLVSFQFQSSGSSKNSSFSQLSHSPAKVVATIGHHDGNMETRTGSPSQLSHSPAKVAATIGHHDGNMETRTGSPSKGRKSFWSRKSSG